MSEAALRGHQMPWNWSYKGLWRCWEPNPGSSGRPLALLSPELSLQPLTSTPSDLVTRFLTSCLDLQSPPHHLRISDILWCLLSSFPSLCICLWAWGIDCLIGQAAKWYPTSVKQGLNEKASGLVKNGQDKRIPEPSTLPRGTSLRASVYLLRVVFLSSSRLKG